MQARPAPQPRAVAPWARGGRTARRSATLNGAASARQPADRPARTGPTTCRPVLATLLLLTAAATLLAGCSGGPGGATSTSPSPNGVEHLAADQILTEAKAAARSASSVHVSGTQSGTTVDLTVGRNTAVGTVMQGGLTVQLLAVDGKTYIKGDQAFWDTSAGAGAGAALAGKWVVAGATTADTSALASFTDIGRVIDQVLAPTGPLTRTGVTTVDGQRVVGITSTDNGDILYVALDGPPYPVRIDPGGSAAPSLGPAPTPPTFSAWNAPLVVHPPPPDQVVDLSKPGA